LKTCLKETLVLDFTSCSTEELTRHFNLGDMVTRKGDRMICPLWQETESWNNFNKLEKNMNLIKHNKDDENN